MKTLLLSLSILFLGLCLVAFRETRTTEDHAKAVQVSFSTADAPALSTPAAAALTEPESVLQRLPWFAMLCAWIGGNVLVLVGLWTAWRFFGRGSGTSAGLSLAA